MQRDSFLLRLRLAIVPSVLGYCLLPIQAADLRFEPNVMVPMRDGVKLATHVYRPSDDTPRPVILMRTPYGKPGADFGDARRYVEAGYVMVTQDCRGRGQSEGQWDPFLTDGQDGVDTQTWVSQQPWCNGTLGTAGGSYVGWTQWASAPDGIPALKCAVPVVPFADVYDDIAYPGGTFQLALLMGWGLGVGGVALSPEQLQKAYRHLPLQTFADQFDKRVPYLEAWVRHARYDDYWKARGIDRRYQDIAIPMLNIGGWYDIFAKNTVEMIDRVRETATNRLVRRNQFVVMGPWAHGPGVRKVGDLDFGEEATLSPVKLQFEWFEYWLNNKNTGVEGWPPFYLFVMGENRWRGEQEWPLKGTRFTKVYLHSLGHANTREGDGVLAVEAPGDEPADTFRYDPNDPVPSHGGNNLVGASAGPKDQSAIELRDDVLVYTSDVLQEAIEVTGPVRLRLHVASTAPDTDFTGKLVDVHPDGKAYNLCEGILRARYREGREREVPMNPGEVVVLDIDLWVTSNVFLPGHRIRLEVSSSNFPRFDRNPNTGLAFGTDQETRPATQTVFHNTDHPSHLLLPVIPPNAPR